MSYDPANPESRMPDAGKSCCKHAVDEARRRWRSCGDEVAQETARQIAELQDRLSEARKTKDMHKIRQQEEIDRANALERELSNEKGQHRITIEKRKEFEGHADRMCQERDAALAEVARLRDLLEGTQGLVKEWDDDCGKLQDCIAHLVGLLREVLPFLRSDAALWMDGRVNDVRHVADRVSAAIDGKVS